jgi:hypothetical protein
MPLKALVMTPLTAATTLRLDNNTSIADTNSLLIIRGLL